MLIQAAPTRTDATPIAKLESIIATVVVHPVPLAPVPLIHPVHQTLITLHPTQATQATQLLTAPKFLKLIRGDCQNLS